MSTSFQHEKPAARINLFLEVAKGDAKKRVELPLRMLVMGDFTGKDSGEPLEDREIININKDNFEDIMRSSDTSVEYTVPNKLKGEGDMKVNLKIEDMKSFHPEQVARQVPELSRLLATRNLLHDLRNRLISEKEFRKKVEGVVKDDAAREKLLNELMQVVRGGESQDGEEQKEES